MQKYPDYNKEDATSKNWEEEEDLRGGTNHITNVNCSLDELPTGHMPTEDTPPVDTSRKGLLTSEFSSALEEEWFSSLEFAAGISTLERKYRH